MNSDEVERLRSLAGGLPDPVTFLASLFAYSPVAYGIVSRDGHPLLMNSAFREMFGVEPPPEYNMLTDNVAREQGLTDLFRRALGGETLHLPTVWYDPMDVNTVNVEGGKRVAMAMTMFPLFDAAGEIAFVAITYKDETEVMSHRVKLEELVAGRTAELKSVIYELESFASAISHELAGPLRGVSAFSTQLARDLGSELSPRHTELFKRLIDSADDMTETLQALLRLSRVTQGPLDRSEINVADIAHAVGQQLAAQHPNREVDFITANRGMRVSADADLVMVLLENLLGNSWKYTAHTAHAQVEIGAITAPAKTGCTTSTTTFFVRDNGAGFDMKRVGRLFEPFQRLHAEKEFAGTGVGLATARRITRRHGGRIWADSEVGRGATFYFTLAPTPAAD